MTSAGHQAVRRRALHEELNRTLVLDAAEEAFGERGYDGASVRDIAARAGFSTAALYLLFTNKQELYVATLLRRGVELLEAMQGASSDHDPPMERLHRIADAAIDFYRQHPHFSRLVAQAHARRVSSPLSDWQHHPDERVRAQFDRAMAFEASVIRRGQELGEIREGPPAALAHLFSVLVNSFLAVGAPTVGDAEGLSLEQLHAIIDGTFRTPPSRSRR